MATAQARMNVYESATSAALIVEAATPEQMARIAEMLAEVAPWVLPVFAASPAQADDLETALARRNGLVVQRVRTADELAELLEALRRVGPSRRPASWLGGLLRLSLAISSIQDQDSLLEELLGQATALTDAAHGCVWLVDDTDGLLKHVACAPDSETAHAVLPPGLPEWVQENRKAILITAAPVPSLLAYTRAAMSGLAALSIRLDRKVKGEALAVPLMAASRLLGVLCLQAGEPREAFTGEQFEAISVMAAQVAMSLEGARLFARVQQGKKEWEATFDAIGESVLLISPEGKILRANQAAARAAGLRFTQLVGAPCCEAMSGTPHPPDGCPLQQVLQTRRPASAEITDRDGSRIRHVAIYPIFDARGDIQAVVEYARDITQIKAAQARLMQAEKLSALGELTAGVAHELNNPLTSILGFVQLLQRTELSDRQSSYLSVIHDETRRAARIVRNLLTFARRQEPEKKMLDINTILEETLSLLAYQLRVSSVKVEQDLDPNLPKTAADPYQLQQVFVNIINNAQQAMQEAHGGGTLTIRTMPVLRPAGYARNTTLNLADQPDSTLESWVRVEFADDGPGIPPELLTRIFDPFFTTKAPGKGTGLGLSVCHGIIRDHDGHIWAESTPGRGATFVLELPVRGIRRAEAEKAATDRLPELPPGNVLVLDDEEGTLRLLKELLSQHDQKVDTLANGADARERIAGANYDVILCDVRMPGFGGDALYEYLKEHRPELVKRLVFITGDTASVQTRAFLRKAGRPVVEKPFDVAELLRVIQNIYRDVREQ
ncbi:MAG: ATP-binding protein [Anaerolineae bacterium]|nr:ATP-binding protein [Anaerolineae bacterium]